MSKVAKDEHWTNPTVLTWARDRMGMTRREVAEQSCRLSPARYYARVSEQQLEEWETGKSEPELRHLETLAEIYCCPVGYFFLDHIPDSPAIGTWILKSLRAGAKLTVDSGECFVATISRADKPLVAAAAKTALGALAKLDDMLCDEAANEMIENGLA